MISACSGGKEVGSNQLTHRTSTTPPADELSSESLVSLRDTPFRSALYLALSSDAVLISVM